MNVAKSLTDLSAFDKRQRQLRSSSESCKVTYLPSQQNYDELTSKYADDFNDRHANYLAFASGKDQPNTITGSSWEAIYPEFVSRNGTQNQRIILSNIALNYGISTLKNSNIWETRPNISAKFNLFMNVNKKFVDFGGDSVIDPRLGTIVTTNMSLGNHLTSLGGKKFFPKYEKISSYSSTNNLESLNNYSSKEFPEGVKYDHLKTQASVYLLRFMNPGRIKCEQKPFYPNSGKKYGTDLNNNQEVKLSLDFNNNQGSEYDMTFEHQNCFKWSHYRDGINKGEFVEKFLCYKQYGKLIVGCAKLNNYQFEELTLEANFTIPNTSELKINKFQPWNPFFGHYNSCGDNEVSAKLILLTPLFKISDKKFLVAKRTSTSKDASTMNDTLGTCTCQSEYIWYMK